MERIQNLPRLFDVHAIIFGSILGEPVKTLFHARVKRHLGESGIVLLHGKRISGLLIIQWNFCIGMQCDIIFKMIPEISRIFQPHGRKEALLLEDRVTGIAVQDVSSGIFRQSLGRNSTHWDNGACG